MEVILLQVADAFIFYFRSKSDHLFLTLNYVPRNGTKYIFKATSISVRALNIIKKVLRLK